MWREDRSPLRKCFRELSGQFIPDPEYATGGLIEIGLAEEVPFD
jgi:hypothetical protein